MAVARAKGKLKGKPPKLSCTQRHHLYQVVDSGEYTQSEIAELFSVSRATIYREVQRRAASGTQGWNPRPAPDMTGTRPRPGDGFKPRD